MKYTQLFIILLCTIPVLSNAQFTDDFSDENFTSNPVWSGTSSLFIVNATQQLQLNAPAVSGEAYLSTYSEAVAEAEWNWQTMISVNPSSTNYTSIYLMSDRADLGGELNGYFVKIGGINDEVSLFRQNGTSESLIIDGLDDRVNQASVNIRVRVRRDAAGNWELAVRNVADTDFVIEGTAFDNTFSASSYAGVYCKYTSTRNTAFSFDDFAVNGSPVPDITPPVILDARAVSSSRLSIRFSEAVTAASALLESNYLIGGQPPAKVTHVEDSVWLELSTPLENGIPQQLSISGIQDLSENQLADTSLTLLFFEPVAAWPEAIVINEILPDPNPGLGTMPDATEAEFIELYNTSTSPFELENWQLNGNTLPSYILLPGHYLILCRNTYAADYSAFGPVLGLSSWPTLSNSGSTLSLKDPDGLLVDSLSYSGKQVMGGYSLERIRTFTPCSGKLNFGNSQDSRGGSPGMVNSLLDESADITAPLLLSVQPLSADSLLLLFDERIYFPAGLENAVTFENYQLTQSDYADEDSTSLLLLLQPELVQESYHTLGVEQVSDCEGNVGDRQEASFYFDRQPPAYKNFTLKDTAEIVLHFSEKLSSASANVEANFTVKQGPELKKSSLYGDSTSILLEFESSMAEWGEIRLHISSLTDLYENSIPEENPDSLSFHFYSDLDTLIILNEYQLKLKFNQPVKSASAQAENFDLAPNLGMPALVIQDPADASFLTLIFEKPLPANRDFMLALSGLQDTSGQLLSTPLYRFTFDRREPRITEIVAEDSLRLQLYFDEMIINDSSKQISLWLNDEPQASVQVLLKDEMLLLELEKPLLQETLYEVKISGLTDIHSNPVDAERETSFFYDQRPPRLDTAYLLSPHQIMLVFHETLKPQQEALRFSLEGHNLSPDSVQFMRLRPSQVLLHFGEPLPQEVLHFSLSGISDMFDNEVQTPLSYRIEHNQMKLAYARAVSWQSVELGFTHEFSQNDWDPSDILLEGLKADSLLQLSAYRLLVFFPETFAENKPYRLKVNTSTWQVERQVYYEDGIRNINIDTDRSLQIFFEEALDDSNAEAISHYLLDQKHPHAALYVPNEKMVKLFFTEPFEDKTIYSLILKGIQDVDGFTLASSRHLVGKGRKPERLELLITEMMPDPNPPVGLPDAEFVEIFNASDELLSLQGISFSDSKSSSRLPEVMLHPGEYLILCASSNLEKFNPYGKILGLSSFPSLNADSDTLSLLSQDGSLIHQVAYSDAWYNDAIKKQGGWSLEMIDVAWPCRERENWTASSSPTGGTPGKLNASATNNPDLTGPVLLAAFAEDTTLIRLIFDEKLSLNVIQTGRIWLEDEILNSFQLSKDHKSLLVNVSPLKQGKTYQLKVEGITDCSGNLITDENRHASLLLPEAHQKNDIIVSEFLTRPRSEGTDFIELYNASAKPISIKNWQLARLIEGEHREKSLISNSEIILLPGAYLALCADTEALRNSHHLPENALLRQTDAFPTLPAKEGGFVLLDQYDSLMQQIDYDEDWHHSLIRDTRGVSLERIDPDAPENEAANWQSAASTAGYATPGYQNSQWRNDTRISDVFYADPQVFFPDQSGYRDYTLFTFELNDPGSLASVQIFDTRGRLVRILANNISLSQQALLKWDGTDAKGNRAQAGHYIVRAEVIAPSGNVNVLKTKVVIGTRF